MHRMQCAARRTVLAAGLAAVLTLSGCGTPGAPQPPSLNLPEPVADLTAVRAGSQITLAWTMPKKNTDKLLLKGNVAVRICRSATCATCGGASSSAKGSGCSASAVLSLAPGAAATFTETLPAALTAGLPRLLSYSVELTNRNGRSAGLSNAAEVLAGVAPGAVTGLTAEVRRQGVALHWTPVTGQAFPAAIRLRRTLLTPPPAAKPHADLLTPEPEPLEQNLLVDSCEKTGSKGRCRALDRALDKSIRFGESYAYRAQRVARVQVGKETLELDGPLSAPVRVEALDIFPPEVPTGLAAVATVGDTAPQSAIDLSWQPVADANLAGYIVYRREGEADWQRISPALPQAAPAFHDTNVQTGHTYRYAVSAIGQNGHESARSAEAQETTPGP